MLILTSPSKSLDFETDWGCEFFSAPEFIDKSTQLADILKGYSQEKLGKVLGVSDKLAAMNVDRFTHWSAHMHDPMRARPAILAYTGHIYQQMHPRDYSTSEQKYAQSSLRIISGLYGLLRPYDLILPYRLEMKVKLANPLGKDLYKFWKLLVTEKLNQEVRENQHKLIVNLASTEYSKVVDPKKLVVPMLNVTFNQRKGRELKNIMLYSKQARGMMLEYLIRNKVESYQELLGFDVDGYKLTQENENEVLFVKDIK